MEKLPGIGPRQASRFIWAMIDFAPQEKKKLSELIDSLDQYLARCNECFRVFNVKASQDANFSRLSRFCGFCHTNSKRNRAKIMVVEKDSDLLNIEKSGAYNGLYYVLGGVVDALNEELAVRERIKQLHARIQKTPGVRNEISGRMPGVEIILALSPSKLGEFTGNYISKVLEPLNVKITRLGRGLATGTDLEYADETTIRQALDNRK